MTLLRTGLTAAIALSLATACSPQQESKTAEPTAAGGDPVATVNGQPIGQQTFDILQQEAAKQGNADPQALLDELVTLEVLAQEARKQGLDETEQARALLWQKQVSTLANALLGDYLDGNPVSEKDIRAEYDRRMAERDTQTEYKARHILVDTEDQARSLIEKLEGGADFAELAKAESTGPSGEKGGDLGWFTQDRMVPAFSEAVAALEPGNFSQEPVKTRFGYHVILLEKARDQAPPSFEQLKNRIKADLLNQALDAHIKQLREEADVEIYADEQADQKDDA